MANSNFLDRLFGVFRERAPLEPDTAPPPPPTGPIKVEFDFDDPRVPDTAQPKIEIVRQLITEIEERAATDSLWSPLLFELRQMGDVHLPTLLQSYVDIPARHRAEIFRKTGHSASFVLNDGLDKMADRLREMCASQAQGNLDAFTANMRFIESRYGAGYAPFD